MIPCCRDPSWFPCYFPGPKAVVGQVVKDLYGTLKGLLSSAAVNQKGSLSEVVMAMDAKQQKGWLQGELKVSVSGRGQAFHCMLLLHTNPLTRPQSQGSNFPDLPWCDLISTPNVHQP